MQSLNFSEVDNITIMTGKGRNGDEPDENSRFSKFSIFAKIVFCCFLKNSIDI